MIHTSPAQDKAMRTFLDKVTKNPGNYDLDNRNCVSNVRGVLGAAGIATPNTIYAREFMGGLGQMFPK